MDDTFRVSRPDAPPPKAAPGGTARPDPENLLFGALAVKLGFSSPDQVDACLRTQQKMRALGGAPRKIGELLVEKGWLKPDQVQEVLAAQARHHAPAQIPGYRIVSKIGQGSMGAIYKAVQLSMDRAVALKILSPKYAENARFVERFFREARAVAKLNHPNIIQGIDVGEVGGVYYFVMEFVDGPTVGELIRRGGALDEKRALHILLQIARALAHAWKSDLLHRDIKPDNLMITRDGIAKLCDLGLAKHLAPGEDPAGTNPGAALGTPYYISPEQARGEQDLDPRTDIYSLGATLYHLVTGEVPFPGDNAAVVIAKHLTDPLVPPRQRNPLVSRSVDALITRMMARERDRRHQTPEELLHDIESIPREPGVPIEPPADARRDATKRHSHTALRRRFLSRRRFR